MSLFSKAVSLAFLATTLVTDSLEKSMTKAKSKPRQGSPARVRSSNTALRSFNAEKETAKQAVADAGRATLAMAQYGARRTAEAGRTVLARAARSAGHGIDDGL